MPLNHIIQILLQAYKKGAALKSLGGKGCEIKDGSQMTAMMVMITNFASFW